MEPIPKFSGGVIPAERLAHMAEDPYWDEEEARGIYSLPLGQREQEPEEQEEEARLTVGIPSEELYEIPPFICARSPQSHKGPYRHAIDFLVLDGTSVKAAAAGMVVESIDRFTRWGDDPMLASEMNLVTIRHDWPSGTEFTQYCHLAQGSLLVRPGMSVYKDRPIARVGKVGWTDRDHLHFIVFRADTRHPGFKSLRVSKFI